MTLVSIHLLGESFPQIDIWDDCSQRMKFIEILSYPLVSRWLKSLFDIEIHLS